MNKNELNLWDHVGQWGNNLIFHFDRRSVIGHHPKRYSIENGMIMNCKMESGKIAQFKIKNVEYFSDPNDMLRFDVEDIGYKE